MYWEKKIETISRDELTSLQISRLKESVRKAMNSPHYKRVLSAVDCDPRISIPSSSWRNCP